MNTFDPFGLDTQDDDAPTMECAGAAACTLRQAPVDEWGEINPNPDTCALVATCGMREGVLTGSAQWQTVQVHGRGRGAPRLQDHADMAPAESAMWDALKDEHRKTLARQRTARLLRAGLPADAPLSTRVPAPRINPFRDDPHYHKPTAMTVRGAVDTLCNRVAGVAPSWVRGMHRAASRAGDPGQVMERLATLEDEFGPALDVMAWALDDGMVCERADALAGHVANRVNLVYQAGGVSMAEVDKGRQRAQDSQSYQQAAGHMPPRQLADWAKCMKVRPLTPDEEAEHEALMARAWDAVREAVDYVARCCEHHHVPAPQLAPGVKDPFEAVRGAIARACDPKWWRRALRTTARRLIEAGAIKLGTVNRRAGGYCSDVALNTRRAQKRRNANALATTFMTNEAGQVYSLAELAASSVSNPVNRGGELMTRIRGCEEYAEAAGHVGLFVTLTCPSAMHRMLAKEYRDKGAAGAAARAYDAAAGAYEAVPNPNWDKVSTPRTSQKWLTKRWGLARSALARKGVKYYGFRVAEPHHDGTPHWHMLLWCESQQDANRLQALLFDYWVKRDKDYAKERGADKYRTNFKRMDSGGAAGYIAKYIAKSIGHHALAEHWDTAGAGGTGDLFTVEMGDAQGQGHERVDAWAGSWGIRQFQHFGLPSVTLWREIRRVTPDQVQNLGRADAAAQLAWRAAQKIGEKAADWCAFLHALGGVCLPREQYALQLAVDDTPRKNAYGEHAKRRRVRGVVSPSGKWLVSRRQMWRALDGEESREAKARAARGETPQDEAQRAARGAPWTGFNNCTARLRRGRHCDLWAESAEHAKAQNRADNAALMARFLAPLAAEHLEMFGATPDELQTLAQRVDERTRWAQHAPLVDELLRLLGWTHAQAITAMEDAGLIAAPRRYADPAPITPQELDAAMEAMAAALGY